MANRNYTYKRSTGEYYWGNTIKLIESKGRGVVELQVQNNLPFNGYISGLNVVDSERNKGVATFLMDSIEEIISNCGLNAVIDVEKEQQWLIKWYQKRGYKIVPYDYQDDEMNDNLCRMFKKRK